MKNGWTGGQYSIFRFLFGVYLAVHFASLIPYGAEVFSNTGALPDGSASPLLWLFPNVLAIADSPLMVTLLLGIATVASLLVAIGWRDRLAAVAAWYLLACLFGRNPLIANPSMPFVGWMLLAHAALPSAPFGSWTARKRIDPAGGWSFTPSIFGAAWIVMSLAYSYSGYTKLMSPSWVNGTALARVAANPLARPTFVRDLIASMPDALVAVGTWGTLGLELLYAPLALSRRARPLLWLVMVSMHIGLMVMIDFADLSIGMLLLHLFTFDPAWVPSRRAAAPDSIFYDGSCALCHGAVRFLMAEDREGTLFRFSPLQGSGFERSLSAQERAALPDSVLVLTADHRLLTKSAAALYAATRLGGMWRIAAAAGGVLPPLLRDVVYDAVAKRRKRWFGEKTDACPLMPPELRKRFIA